MSKGFFITLEGIDGCGKTTQARLLADYLTNNGKEVLLTREPGGTEIGRRIRSILLDPENKNITGLTELLLYSADRAQHVKEMIQPALEDGKIVICDRFIDATIAYQGYARGLDLSLISTVSNIAINNYIPQLTFFLDLPVQIAVERTLGRTFKGELFNEARFEEEPDEFYEKVRLGYLNIYNKESNRMILIEAKGSIDEIQEEIIKKLEGKITGGGINERNYRKSFTN